MEVDSLWRARKSRPLQIADHHHQRAWKFQSKKKQARAWAKIKPPNSRLKVSLRFPKKKPVLTRIVCVRIVIIGARAEVKWKSASDLMKISLQNYNLLMVRISMRPPPPPVRNRNRPPIFMVEARLAKWPDRETPTTMKPLTVFSISFTIDAHSLEWSKRRHAGEVLPWSTRLGSLKDEDFCLRFSTITVGACVFSNYC